MTAMGQHGVRVADDPGTQPPERRRSTRRKAPDGIGSTGGRRVTPDRRKRATATNRPQPWAGSAEEPEAAPAHLNEMPDVAPADLMGEVEPEAAPAHLNEMPDVAPADLMGQVEPEAAPAHLNEMPDVAPADLMGQVEPEPFLPEASDPGASDIEATRAWAAAPTATSSDLPEPVTQFEAATAPSDAVFEARTPWLPMLDDRSPDPATCPFLRGVEAGPDGRERTVLPVESPDPANRCAALTDAVPQSLRQQELVCLTTGHINCPRYLRGAVVMPEPVASTTRTGPSVSPAILASVAVLVAAFAASIAFVTARGGLAMDPIATIAPSASAIAVVTPTPATAEPTIVITPEPTADPTATPEPTLAPTLTPTPEPTPAPTPEPTPRRTSTPPPTSDRYRLLDPCPDAPDCWIYAIRAGDNLFSIANYFGVSLDAIYGRNPWAESTPLRAGMQLRLPPPTR